MHLTKKVEVKRGERQVLISKAVVGIEQLVNQFAKGDRHARKDLMDIAQNLVWICWLARGVKSRKLYCPVIKLSSMIMSHANRAPVR